jgi:hypothetical protein
MLDQLATEEQELHAALKALRIKKQAALEALAEEQAFEEQLRHEAVMAQAEQFKELVVLGVTYSKLRHGISDAGLRIVSVHRDVRKLLSAALPSVSEQQFSQLVASLVTRLSNNSLRVRPAIDALKADSATAHYFDLYTNESVSIPIVLTGRLAAMRPALLSEMITAYALSWGKATQYEDSENE